MNFTRRAPLAIVRYPDPRLRAPNADVTVFDAALKQLASDMFTLMYKCAAPAAQPRAAAASP